MEHNQNLQNLQHNQMIEEDEIDLRELAKTIGRYKWKILFFSIIVTGLSVAFALSKPNEYESSTLLMPQENAKPSIGGGLAALAGMAGVDVGGGGNPGPEESFNALLHNYDFMKEFVLKYDLPNKLYSEESQKNYQFALGYDGVYKFLNGKGKSPENNVSQEEMVFNTVKNIEKTIVIATDKKSSILTMSAKHSDPYMAKYLVESFLSYASAFLKSKDMKDNDKQIAYYNEAIRNTSDIALKVKLAELASALIQKKVLSDANEFYNVKQFTKPDVAYVKDKVGPKRALIVVVAFVTSLILGIFGAFFIEFLKGNKEEENL
ncbi:MAG: Wzz/FepE/Etk N-terminal domain-containing protein [Arcobacteraceae bacterium]|nr:Wzz/FepE/Etk N-terminal domain-containing protein [Arcobacteraceae bacterium]